MIVDSSFNDTKIQVQSIAELKIFIRTKLGPEAIRLDQFNDFEATRGYI